MAEPLLCPFACGYKGQNEYGMQAHIEEHHTENSPFAVKTPGIPPLILSATEANRLPIPQVPFNHDSDYVICARPDCGEYILLADLGEHSDMHDAIESCRADDSASVDPKLVETGGNESEVFMPAHNTSEESSNHEPPTDPFRSPGTLHDHWKPQTIMKDATNKVVRKGRKLLERSTPRLSMSEFGPHANEKEMPPEVRRVLIEGGKPQQVSRIGSNMRLETGWTVTNQTPDLIHVLADTFTANKATFVTYLASPAVCHIAKLDCEGGFCGYWNTQMCLTSLRTQRSAHNIAIVPNILEMQDTIEAAWEKGICPQGQAETGGIRGTRKWIGSCEVEAFFKYSGTDCKIFTTDKVGALLDYVEEYFLRGNDAATMRGTSLVTKLPALFFQRRGHSVTCIGIEKMVDGRRNLLVFDPSWATTGLMRTLANGGRVRSTADTLLRPYRKSELTLSKYESFEIVNPIQSHNFDQPATPRKWDSRIASTACATKKD